MAKSIRKPRQIGSIAPFDQEKFNKVLRNMIENPSAENKDRIDHIRLWFVHSTHVTQYICKQMQGLTLRLLAPDEEALRVIHNMIGLCRQLSKNSKLLAQDYELLWDEGIIVSEIDNFKKAYIRLQEMIYYVESVYLSLPNGLVVDEVARRN